MKTLLLAAFLLSGAANAETGAPYAGQDAREIASLSAEDVAALLAGDGWGLAKPAELNGWPGPAHILENADRLDLSDAQREQIEAIRATMLTRAQALGADYIEAERRVSMMFRHGHAEPETIRAALRTSAGLLAELRAAHLDAHIAATPVLTDAQRETYAELRGYAGDSSGHAGHGGQH